MVHYSKYLWYKQDTMKIEDMKYISYKQKWNQNQLK